MPKHKQACLKSVFHFKHAGPLSGKKIILPGELILNKKKPAAFCFRRSATPTLPGFASLRFAKPAAMLRRVRERLNIRLQTREKCLLPEICIQLKRKSRQLSTFPRLQYHRRKRAWLPCSEWERVLPLHYGHRHFITNFNKELHP